MASPQTSKSAAVRARLNHPVIDSDGHTVEFFPAVLDYLKQIGGAKIAERYQSGGFGGSFFGWYRLSPEERRDRRPTRPPWWALPTKNTLDRATATLPKLLYERLDDIGLDFTVLYPTLGLFPPHFEDEELRRAACRAFNAFHADLFREYADLIGHWEKRNSQGLENYNPANLNRELLLDLYRCYGGKTVEEKLEQLSQEGDLPFSSREDGVDDWAPCRIERVEDIRDLFVPNFYFGCEADDPMNAWAFNRKVNPFGVQLKAIFSSDIGHWDVPDMTEVVEEAHELVEERVITEEDFRDFVFTNPATLWTDMNPDFFKGTVVEGQVNKLLGQKNNR